MLFALIYTVLLLFLLKKLGFFNLPNFKGWGLYAVFSIKFALAVLLYHFPYDTLRDSSIYFNDSLALSDVLLRNPRDFFALFFDFGDTHTLYWKHMQETLYWSHESSGLLSEKRNVIRVNAVFQLLSFQNAYLVFLWNTIVTILGLKLLYQALSKFASDYKNVFFLLIFLLPSTLLWTANIMKENYVVLGLGLFVYGLLNAGKRASIFTISGLIIMLFFKQYVGIGFGLGYAAYLLLRIAQPRLKYLAIGVSLTVFSILAMQFSEKITSSISAKQTDFMRLAEGGIVLNDFGQFYRLDIGERMNFEFYTGEEMNLYGHVIKPAFAMKINERGADEAVFLEPSDKRWYVVVNAEESGSRINITPIQNNPMQLLQNMPEALVNVLFRPWPNDPPHSLMKWYFILENILIWMLLIWAATRIRTSEMKNVLVVFIVASLFIALMVGWITPVLGAIVRYKMPIVLSLIAVSWLLLQPKTQQNQEKIS